MPNIFVKVPEPTLRRLPWYLAYAKLARQGGETHISSTQFAQKIGIDASVVAKDFSFVTLSGKTRVGYEIDELIRALDEFLGFSSGAIAERGEYLLYSFFFHGKGILTKK